MENTDQRMTLKRYSKPFDEHPVEIVRNLTPEQAGARVDEWAEVHEFIAITVEYGGF